MVDARSNEKTKGDNTACVVITSFLAARPGFSFYSAASRRRSFVCRRFVVEPSIIVAR